MEEIEQKTEEKIEQKAEERMNIQEYLSLGYIYLLVVGLITDSIFYNYLNINILHYSTFLDILITPISLLISNVIIPSMLVFMSIAMYFWGKFAIKKTNKSGKIVDKNKQQRGIILGLAFLILGFYTGLSIGKSSGLAENIKEGKLRPNSYIIFNNGKEMSVNVVGQNSYYIFYVPENTKKVLITPIMNTIFQIRKLDESERGIKK